MAETTRDVVVVMVCVSSRIDCGRHCCALLPATEKEEKCFLHPVWCWRCVQRSGGLPDVELVKPEEVSSKFSTTLESVQTVFGLGVTYPAEYSEEEFLAGGWASEAGLSQEDVVGSVDVMTPMDVVEQYSDQVALGALSDSGLVEAPEDFIGLGEARTYLTSHERTARGRQCGALPGQEVEGEESSGELSSSIDGPVKYSDAHLELLVSLLSVTRNFREVFGVRRNFGGAGESSGHG
jgi:hypothetical protein